MPVALEFLKVKYLDTTSESDDLLKDDDYNPYFGEKKITNKFDKFTKICNCL